MVLSFALVAGGLGWILITVIVKGLPALNLAMLTQTPKGGYYLGKAGGILNAIVGSLYLAGGATLLALLLSLPLALYLEVYAPRSRWSDLVRLALDVLWGIPSIVYGAFAFIVMLALGMRASLLGGIFVLTLLEMPIMTRAMDEVIRLMPQDLEAGLAGVGRHPAGDRPEGGHAPDAARHRHRRPAGFRPRHWRRRLGAVHRRLHRPHPHLAFSASRLAAPGGLLPVIYALPRSPAARLCGGSCANRHHLDRQPQLALAIRPLEPPHDPLTMNGGLMNAHVQIQNLNVYYARDQALKNITLEIPRGQITVIMGPSGCGKTTLLKSINRFLELNDETRLEGRVLIDGQNIYAPNVDVMEIRKKAGLLAQRPYPLPMSIYDNVAYGMRIHQMKKKGSQLNHAVQHYLEIAGLWEEVKERLHAPATGLSIGQQQRLCLARGLAVEPEMLLGDEPTSALDPISAQNIEMRLLDLKHRYTIVLVTHILRQARRLADYVIFMYMGEVVEYGPARQVFDNPRQERTRAYLEGQF